MVSDRVTRAITYDGAFRVIACRTTELVREAVRLQQVEGLDARTYGELLTGAVLVRETMAPMHRVQAILSLDGVGSMIADSHPTAPPDADAAPGTATTRGLVNRKDEPQARATPLLSPGAVLKVIRSLPRGRLHQSIVAANAQSGGMAEALMSYMQESEQVYATLGVATVVDGPRVIASGGFIVQLLPEVTDGPLAVMTERLKHDFTALDPLVVAHDADPGGLAGWLLGELLFGMTHEVLSDDALAFGCDCSMARVLGAIATLGHDELAAMVAKAEVVELTCEYCTKAYAVGPEQIRTLLEPA